MFSSSSCHEFRLVPIGALKLGMYVQELRMPWWQHAFYRTSFLLEDVAVLGRLAKHGRDHLVLVDVSRSLPEAFAPDEATDSAESVEAAALSCEEAPEATPASPSPAPSTPTTEPAPARKKQGRTSLADELHSAQRLVQEAKRAIQQAMKDGRTGRIQNLNQIQDLSAEMVASTARNAGALQTLTILKTVDDYTFTHCVAVGTFMISLGRTLGLSEDELCKAGAAGLLHDVGKAGISAAVLNKAGKLTDSEFAYVRKHPEVGELLLRDSGYTDSVTLDVVRHHHERLDGRGYPDALKGDEVSVYARMGAITDVYDAVTSRRSYHAAIHPTAALQMLLKNGNTQFDAAITHAFVRTVGLYPNGALVRLKSDKLAVVVEQSPEKALKPIVRAFFSIARKQVMEPHLINLADSADTIVAYEEPEAWRIHHEHIRNLLGLPAALPRN